MATFNIQHQTVQHQYSADTINFYQSQTPDDFFHQLKNLQIELQKAIEAKAITGEKAVEAEMHIKEALLQAEETTPDKKTLTEHLASAKELVTNVDGLVTACTRAIESIRTLF
ncbi:MAG: hypothetical protein L3J89_14725 [Gammaproteobacteria bacterium]|nr:hypothetical protein [Gammaproteobacteria bacterium]